jgi:hypothetical protein
LLSKAGQKKNAEPAASYYQFCSYQRTRRADYDLVCL